MLQLILAPDQASVFDFEGIDFDNIGVTLNEKLRYIRRHKLSCSAGPSTTWTSSAAWTKEQQEFLRTNTNPDAHLFLWKDKKIVSHIGSSPQAIAQAQIKQKEKEAQEIDSFVFSLESLVKGLK